MKELVVVRKQKRLSLPVSFLKKDIVFTVSLILALASCFLHPPKLEYINLKVIISLFNLMLVIKAFEELKLLDKFAISILNKCHTSKKVSAILVFLCFFSSMFVTNDVALITFVPLTLIISKKLKNNMMETIILQTIAANLGSSLTPMGNPQNLFIFTYYGIKPLQFFGTIFLLAILGIVILGILLMRLKGKELNVVFPASTFEGRKKAVVWGVVFAFIIASIFGVVSDKLAFFLTLAAVCLLDIHLLRKIDYTLLFTFICFFVFIGNISNTSIVNTFANESLDSSHSVFFTSILLSQLISNVPASLLLAKFTPDWQPLLMGVNIGGLGTIIASLASVISYKLFIWEFPEENKKYLIKFSIYNFSFLAGITLIQYLIGV
ncbi:SLC13 family permease [Neobacillus citreus]|uniref:Anion permease n=1 Tax=Neobacillus citreus TaxID=2833578 RepID=A0A942Y703_9BACI|nr:anion permease [Neobacillus citreus]